MRSVASRTSDALGLVEPGQVEEVRVLPVLVLDVVVPDEDRAPRAAPPPADGEAAAIASKKAARRARRRLGVVGMRSFVDMAHALSRRRSADSALAPRCRTCAGRARSWPPGWAAGQFPHDHASTDRRRKRSHDPLVALHYQLAHARPRVASRPSSSRTTRGSWWRARAPGPRAKSSRRTRPSWPRASGPSRASTTPRGWPSCAARSTSSRSTSTARRCSSARAAARCGGRGAMDRAAAGRRAHPRCGVTASACNVRRTARRDRRHRR